MVVFSLFFGNLAKIPSDGIPYPIFSYAALVPWTFFANGLTNSANSVVGSQNLITKVYFPRAGDSHFQRDFRCDRFLAGVCCTDCHDAGLRHLPTVNVIWLPFLLLLAFITPLGRAVAFGAQRSIPRYSLCCAVSGAVLDVCDAHRLSQQPDQERLLRAVYGLNPMAGVVEGFRWALLNSDTAPGPISDRVDPGSNSAAGQWAVLFSPDGKDVCGRGLMSNIAVRVEGLGKQYFIGAREEHATAISVVWWPALSLRRYVASQT